MGQYRSQDFATAKTAVLDDDVLLFFETRLPNRAMMFLSLSCLSRVTGEASMEHECWRIVSTAVRRGGFA
jgi:hypothetical protein